MATGNDDVQVKFGADTTGIDKGAKHTAEVLQGLRTDVMAFGESLKAAAAGFTAAFAVDKIRDFIQGIAELGDTTEDTAAQLGVTVERIGELQYIAESSGDSLGSLSAGMARLAYNSQKAIAGSQTEADAFKRLGVSLKDAEGNVKSIDELLSDTAESFSTHADGAEKVALAMQLMGRAGVNMIPVLNMGRAEFERLQEVARRTGTVLSASVVKGMMEVHQSLTEVNASFRGLGIAIFNSFQPAINGVLKTVAELVQHFTDWISKSYDTGGAMRYVAMMVDVVVSAVMTLVAAFEVLWDVASGILSSIGIALGAVGKGLSYAIAGNFAAVAAEGKAASDALVKTWTDTGGSVAKVLETYKNNIKEMWAATLNPPAEIRVAVGGAGGAKPAYSSPTDFGAQTEKLNQLKKTLQDVRSAFEGTFSTIIGAFDKAISGLINGTMDWKEAMFSVIDSLWSALVKFLEDWLSKWLANEALMLVTHEQTNAAKVASDMAADDASAGKMITDAIKAIFTSSKQTAAGVTANLSPTLGPAAIPAGLAAGAAVAGLASFDVGAWNLPQDQVAQVHKGEMIVPARGGAADAMRDMLSGGGPGGGAPSFTFNGPVLDKAGLTRMIVGEMNRNPSLRGKW